MEDKCGLVGEGEDLGHYDKTLPVHLQPHLLLLRYMNWLDLFIIAFLVAALIRGLEIGFVRQFFSTAGFFIGLFAGALLDSILVSRIHSTNTQALLAIIIVMGLALTGMTIGEYVGLRLKYKLREAQLAQRLDNVFGLLLAGFTLLAAIWLAAAVFRNLPNSAWQKQVRTSRIVALLDSTLPPAPSVLSSLGHLIDPNGFPQVFTGLEPSLPTDTPLPDMGQLTAAVQKDRTGIVKVEGKGCGGVVEGSGFVAAPSEVVTNAHVVAGVTMPYVVDQNGQHKATVIRFDPDLDVAILRVSGIKTTPFELKDQELAKGTAVAVAGYPGGGGFTAAPGAILDSFTAVGRNIYNQGSTERQVYSIKADVEQGNSGGPLIAADGSVAGVIFAKSTAYDQVGYALTIDQILQQLSQTANSTAAVSTGSCAE